MGGRSGKRYPTGEQENLRLLESIQNFTVVERNTSRIRRSLLTDSQQQWFTMSLPNDVFPEPWQRCISAAVSDPCEVFSPNCSDLMDYLRNNHGQFCELFYKAFDDRSHENFFRGIPCSALPTVDDLFQEGCSECVVIPFMGSARRLNLNNLNIYDETGNPRRFGQGTTCFHRSNKLQHIDLSENFEHGYLGIDKCLTSYLSGLEHVRLFNLSSTGLTRLFSEMPRSFPNLQVLDMSKNMIVFHYYNRESSVQFSANIQTLSLAYNLISMVPSNLFSKLISLRELDLGHNQIQDFDFNISALHLLEKLSLEYNMLSEIPEVAREQLIQLTEHVAPRVITVDLSNNQLSCSCSSIPFLTFMNYTKPANLVFNKYEKYLCRDQYNNRVLLHKVNLLSLKFDCLGSGVYVGIGFACAFVVITFILFLSVTIYRKRWWFRYQYFVAYRLWQSYHKIAAFDTPF